MTPWLAFLYKSKMKFLEHPTVGRPYICFGIFDDFEFWRTFNRKGLSLPEW
jgi:hypothetical protein